MQGHNKINTGGKMTEDRSVVVLISEEASGFAVIIYLYELTTDNDHPKTNEVCRCLLVLKIYYKTSYLLEESQRKCIVESHDI